MEIIIKQCCTCAYMLDDGDGSEPYCARRDLYYNVRPEQKGCADWRSNENKLECGSNGVDSDRHKFCPCCGKALLWKEPWTD